MYTSKRTLKRLLYSLLCLTADTLDAIFSLFCSAKKPDVGLKPSSLDSLSDDQIKDLMANAPNLSEFEPIYQLSSDTIARLAYNWTGEDIANCSEANTHRIVSEKTSIPVPHVRRIIRWDRDDLIIMDSIQGSTLAEVWPKYSLWMKIRVAFTLRRYVRQLHRIEVPPGAPPGPLTNHAPKLCDVPSIFGDIRAPRGPFGSYEELTDFFNHRYQLGWKGKDQEATFDDSSPLVITHNNLFPENIIVGEDDRLWVVNWASSGYYPPWFEFAGLMNVVENERFCRRWYDRSWELAVPFICGPYFKQHIWLARAGWGLYHT
ncbi:hypothetical protein D9619_009742 [Psilocybe cf. subviscida]|uniref:Aminoglycoside phosphotransferase domain-containing protein n=1 Tax=Psilocybe cf. subviscida TaxID=2480587 RepID=A0A8H5BN55_9AGAR|nr:hypothetical protein D9619_009742 [Psilocybe cf. subviscida]